MKSGVTLLELSGGSEEAIKSVTTGETGSTEFTVDGQQMLAAFSPVRGTQWSLVIQVPKEDYDNLIDQAMVVAGICTLVVLVISILLILKMARSISRPVKNVTNRMISLADGDLHTEVINLSSGDELEIMTRTLADTVESLNRYISVRYSAGLQTVTCRLSRRWSTRETLHRSEIVLVISCSL